MKKATIVALTVVAFAVVSSAAFAADGLVKKNFGTCGLGQAWFGEKSSLLWHLSAGTTNSYTGTFGVTTGTSGCERFQGIVFNAKVENYVATNLDNLATDMAKGNGEYLNTLAVIMEVSDASKAEFFSKLQKNFSNIYTSDKVTAREVVENMARYL